MQIQNECLKSPNADGGNILKAGLISAIYHTSHGQIRSLCSFKYHISIYSGHFIMFPLTELHYLERMPPNLWPPEGTTKENFIKRYYTICHVDLIGGKVSWCSIKASLSWSLSGKLFSKKKYNVENH